MRINERFQSIQRQMSLVIPNHHVKKNGSENRSEKTTNGWIDHCNSLEEMMIEKNVPKIRCNLLHFHQLHEQRKQQWKPVMVKFLMLWFYRSITTGLLLISFWTKQIHTLLKVDIDRLEFGRLSIILWRELDR